MPDAIQPALARIADALERLAPPPPPNADLDAADTGAAFVWMAADGVLRPAARRRHVPLHLLRGIDAQRDVVVENMRRFARGLPANNVLLWGARGAGKSALVKAAHAAVCQESPAAPPALVEIHRDDLSTLPALLNRLAAAQRRCVLFCDDLSFDGRDGRRKALKGALEGGVEGRPDNVAFHATSNRRHLTPRDMMENEAATAINPSETVEENVSLSDRFGISLGFHPCGQDMYLDIISAHVAHYGLDVPESAWRPKAIAWAAGRGARSGRVAWQFTQDLAAELGRPLSPAEHPAPR